MTEPWSKAIAGAQTQAERDLQPFFRALRVWRRKQIKPPDPLPEAKPEVDGPDAHTRCAVNPQSEVVLEVWGDSTHFRVRLPWLHAHSLGFKLQSAALKAREHEDCPENKP